MRCVPKLSITVGAALVSAAIVAVPAAYAAPEVSFGAGVKPAKSGTKAKPVNATIKLTGAISNADRTQPPVTDTITFLLDRNLKLNGRLFPTCPATTLNNIGPTACPKLSKVGSGTAKAQIGHGAAATILDFSVGAFNGAHGDLVLAVHSNGIQMAFDVSIKRATGAYGTALVVRIPQPLREPVPGLHPSLTALSLDRLGGVVTVKGKRRYYIESLGCTGKRMRFHATYKFEPGSPDQGKNATAPCS